MDALMEPLSRYPDADEYLEDMLEGVTDAFLFVQEDDPEEAVKSLMFALPEGEETPRLRQLAVQLVKSMPRWKARGFSLNGEIKKKADRMRAGRNDPCPCGSGKKYKNCHGRLN
jgi:preprotein translocase subunit SecA